MTGTLPGLAVYPVPLFVLLPQIDSDAGNMVGVHILFQTSSRGLPSPAQTQTHQLETAFMP